MTICDCHEMRDTEAAGLFRVQEYDDGNTCPSVVHRTDGAAYIWPIAYCPFCGERLGEIYGGICQVEPAVRVDTN